MLHAKLCLQSHQSNRMNARSPKRFVPLPGGLEPPTYRLTAERATYCAMEAGCVRRGQF